MHAVRNSITTNIKGYCRNKQYIEVNTVCQINQLATIVQTHTVLSKQLLYRDFNLYNDHRKQNVGK